MSDFVRGLGNLLGRFGRGPEVSDSVERSFSVTGMPTVLAHDTLGSMRVVTGGEGGVAVQVTRRARGLTTDAVPADLEAIQVSFAQDGNTIHVDVRVTTAAVNFNRQVWADVVITVPAAAQLDLRAEAGNVEVGAVRGRLAAKLDAGNLELRGFSGPVVAVVSAGNVEGSDVTLGDGSRLAVSAGRVALGGALAPGAGVEVRVDAGRAQLTLPTDTPAHLEATANVGAITLSGWSIPVRRDIVTARATGDLGDAPSGRLTVLVNIGDVVLTAR
jgi:hypothetical protein